jgi:hypothetical protein
MKEERMNAKDIELMEIEDIKTARALPEERKLAIGAELFDMVREIATAGIRMQNPGITDEMLLKMLNKRLEMI